MVGRLSWRNAGDVMTKVDPSVDRNCHTVEVDSDLGWRDNGKGAPPAISVAEP